MWDFDYSTVILIHPHAPTAAGGYARSLEEGWNNPGMLDEAIRRSIADAEEQSGSKIKEINVGVPGAFTHVYATKVTVPLKGKHSCRRVQRHDKVLQAR